MKNPNNNNQGYIRDCDSKRIAGIQVYKAKLAIGGGSSNNAATTASAASTKKKNRWSIIPKQIRLYNAIFIIIYIFQIIQVLLTMGVPYNEFIAKADVEGFQVMEGNTRLRAEFTHYFKEINAADRRIQKIGWNDWKHMDIEELVQEKKKDREKTVLDSIPKHMRIPGKYQTSFWPTLLFGMLCTIHAFILLLQHWNVQFNIYMNYIECDINQSIDILNRLYPNIMDINAITNPNDDNDSKKDNASKSSSSNIKYKLDKNGNPIIFHNYEMTDTMSSNSTNLPTHAKIISSKKTEKDVLVPILFYPSLGMCIEYHRRKYIYNATEQIWSKIRCRTNFTLSLLYNTKQQQESKSNQKNWIGFPSIQQMIAAQIRYGPNIFQVKQPTFIEMYKVQLLNPFSVFQIFCVLLWAIDSYIMYSMFSLFMIFMFEGTVVFQRLQSFKALQSMGNKNRIIYVYRCYQWIQLNTTELLPGDIISLTLMKPHHTSTNSTTTTNKSLTTTATTSSTDTATTTTAAKPPPTTTTTASPFTIEDDGGDVIPADLLLLRGSTVVNEASLTGESVPQMKEGITDFMLNNNEFLSLSIKTQHKMNVVYAGTKMLLCQSGSGNNNSNDTTTNTDNTATTDLFNHIPLPPDNGCTCFVLRTGFASAQGKLVRMIEGSQEKVKGHEKETGLLLLMLMVFAMISSSYVLYMGMQNKDRSKYELLLHCIIIVTNVIRPELPMQMALAVNTSLMTLLKLHVFCTEPYRVPVAGKLDICLFDKTGTLTTDELVAVGVCELKQLIKIKSISTTTTPTINDNDNDQLNDDNMFTKLNSLSNSIASVVLAGCHSLVVYENETTGDPLESAALRAMKWNISSDTNNAEPKLTTEVVDPITKKNKTITGGKPIILPTHYYYNTNNSNTKQNGSNSSNSITIQEVKIITRHHFSSKLQRMSCVIQAGGNNMKWVVAKGSPEAIGQLLTIKPDGYDATSEYLAKQGYRVIALAYKPLEESSGVDVTTRSLCETSLIFAGFIAFTCMVRRDTSDVLKRLKEGGMDIAMITGDALLTAIHVAKEVHIVGDNNDYDFVVNSSELPKEKDDPELLKNEELRRFIEEKRAANNTLKEKKMQEEEKKKNKNKKANNKEKPIIYLDINVENDDKLYWKSYTDGNYVCDFIPKDIPQLSKQYDLATTGKCLQIALADDVMKQVLQYIKIYARMTPDMKETVIECLHSIHLLCLMCGDGANDVGALKQADVGVALLSGFGNINVGKASNEESKASGTKDTTSEPAAVTAIMSREYLDQIRALPVAMIKMKIRQLGTEPNKYPEIVEKEDLVKLFQIKAREVAIKRHDEKNAVAQKNMTKQELAKENQRLMMDTQRRLQERIVELESQGVSFASFKAMKEFAVAEMEEGKRKKGQFQQARGIEGSAAMLAQQLEATLGGGGSDANMEDMGGGGIPMVKLGDASIAAPFTSKMPSIRSCVDIVRQGRCTLVSSMQMYQIMALQCLISSYALSVLYLDGMKYGDAQLTAMGMLGTVSQLSLSRSKPLDKLSPVKPLNSIFHPASIFSLLGQFAIHLFTTVIAVRAAKSHLPPDWKPDIEGQFQPGILNTVIFLITIVQDVTVIFVNLQGPPFMTSVTQNRPLLWSLIATFILTFMFASETFPEMNRYFQLVPFPDTDFRDYILFILAIDLLATFMFDRLMKFIFARDILIASIRGTTWKDVMGLARTFGVLGFLMFHFLGNGDVWNQLAEMEGAQWNITGNETEALFNDTVTNTTTECLNGICDAIVETAKEIVKDEF